MNNARFEYISLISVISAISVVFLHANRCFWTFSYENYWFSANIIESIFYFAVPLFFMISGALLIDFLDRYDIKTFFNKRITKTVIPYIIWSLIYLVTQLPHLKNITLTYIINGLINGDILSIYWFFIPLFGTYLIMPLLSAVDAEKKKTIFIYLSSILFILTIVIPFTISALNLNIIYPFSFAKSSGYLFYTLTGYLLHKYELKKKYRIILYLLSIFGLLSHCIGTYILSMQAGEIILTFKGYVNLPCALYALGIFVFFKYELVKIMKLHKIKKIINILDYYTFAIYLIHYFVLIGLIKLFSLDETSLIFRLIMPFIIIVISLILTYFVRKVPLLKKILP